MVVFTCNHCGESLQKPRVEKHYQASTCSRNPIAVSCMDCFKDFKSEEYVAHTKCITEDERYSAKGTVHSVKKGEVKQSSWVQTVNSIIEQQQSAKPGIKQLLEMISTHNNIPRKKVKFFNYVKSASGGRIGPNDTEEVWSLLEAHKNAAKVETAENGNDKKKRKSDEDTSGTNGEDSTAPKKKKKKNQPDEETSTVTAAPVAEANKSSTNRKKNNNKKKRKATETEKVGTKGPETVTNDNQPKNKKTKKNGKTNGEGASTEEQVNRNEENAEKKNQQKENGVNDTTLETNDSEFCWRSIFTELLKSQPNGIKRDQLKAKVFEKYTAFKGDIDNEGKLSKQYSKKIKKIGNIKLENDVFIWVD